MPSSIQEDNVTFLVVNLFLAFGIMCDYLFKQVTLHHDKPQ